MLYTTLSKGQWEVVWHDYSELTGKRPNSFEDYVKENQGPFTVGELETGH